MLIKYIGAVSFQEYSTTGVNFLWQPQQSSEVTGARLSLLTATGNFSESDNNENVVKLMAYLKTALTPSSYLNLKVMSAPPILKTEDASNQPAGWGATGGANWGSKALANAVQVKALTTTSASSVNPLLSISVPERLIYQSITGFNDGSNFNWTKPLSIVNGASDTNSSTVVRFSTDSPYFGIATANNGGMLVFCNGEMVNAVKVTFTSGVRYYTLDFSGVRKVRDYKIVLDPGLYLGGLAIGPIDTIYNPKKAYIKIIGDGDSYMQDSTATMPLYNNASVAKLALYLDADYGCFPMGGTGYTAINGTYPNMRSRIANITQAHGGEANIVLIAAGINDAIDGTLSTGATAYYRALRASMPDALFVVVGAWCPIETNGATYKAGRVDPIFAAVRAAGGPYILLDNISGTFETSWGPLGSTGGLPWQTGTGRPGATTGTGNGDVYRTSVDTTHCSAAGYEYLADRILFGVAAAIATY